METNEEWRQVKIDVFPTDYEVSSLGRVRSHHKRSGGKLVKGGEGAANTKPEIRRVWLANPDWDGGSIRPRVDKLVAEAFLGEMPPGHRLVHRNGMVWDDRLENLEYRFAGVPSTELTTEHLAGLTPVDGLEAARVAKELAWEDMKRAQEAFQRAVELAVVASERLAALEALEKAQKGA